MGHKPNPRSNLKNKAAQKAQASREKFASGTPFKGGKPVTKKKKKSAGQIQAPSNKNFSTPTGQEFVPPPGQNQTLQPNLSTPTGPEFAPPPQGFTGNLSPQEAASRTGIGPAAKGAVKFLGLEGSAGEGLAGGLRVLGAAIPVPVGKLGIIFKGVNFGGKAAATGIKNYGSSALEKLAVQTGKLTKNKAGFLTTRQINSKVEAIVNKKIVDGLIKKKGLKWWQAVTATGVGLAIASSFSSTFFGMWGQGEAPESALIIGKDVLREASRTGDYTLVFGEVIPVLQEVTELEVWEEGMLKTPLAPAVGIPNKIKGTKGGVVVYEEFAIYSAVRDGWIPTNFQGEDGKEYYVSPEGTFYLKTQSEDEYWQEKDEKKQAQLEENRAESLAQSKILIELKAQARRDGDSESAAFWDARAAEQRRLELENQKAIVAFWLEYQKLVIEMRQRNAPSNLKFGLL